MTLVPKSGRAMLRRARELFLERGEIPIAYMVNSLLARSWRRSADAGLTPEGRLPDTGRLEEHQLARATERQHELLTHARPVMEYLYAQTRNSDSMVMLSDDHGIVLQTYGDTDFLQRAERIALAPGYSWSERYRGTNGIGTVLAELTPLSVIGGEHFLERNGFLACSAAPIKGPDGRLLGVLDISGDERRYHPHTFGLVRTAAQMMENRLFEACHSHHLRIRFHPLAEGIGTFDEGVAALSESGTIIGANQVGFSMLKLAAADLGITPLSQVLQIRLEDLLDWNRRRAGEPWLVARNDGSRLFVRLEPARGKPASVAIHLPERRKDALTPLDTGDERLTHAIDKARKLLGKPINLLLQGEAGVGKEYFARAFHAAGPRQGAPFISINCAAVQPNLLEAELFGFAPTLCRDGLAGRMREAHGGTLFIDEIGDLPLPLQARLLGVLLEKQLTPLGGKAEPVDFILICATQRNLKTEIEAGRFNADLYYQINGMTLLLPPLRDRRDFQPLLARLLDELSPGSGIALSPDVATAFSCYSWPGNISQLTNALRVACTMLEAEETRIGWQHLPDDLVEELRWQASPNANPATDATENLRELSQATINRAIALSHGNMTEAARRLGISRNTLYRRLRIIKGDDKGKEEPGSE